MSLWLMEFLFDHGFMVPAYERLRIRKAISYYASKLCKAGSCEGLVMAIPEESLTFKWKGVEDVYHETRIQHLKEHEKNLSARHPKILSALLGVAQSSILEQQKKKRAHTQLQKALQSALTKFPAFQDLLDQNKCGKSKTDVAKDYFEMLVKEIEEEEDEMDDRFKPMIVKLVRGHVKRVSKITVH